MRTDARTIVSETCTGRVHDRRQRHSRGVCAQQWSETTQAAHSAGSQRSAGRHWPSHGSCNQVRSGSSLDSPRGLTSHTASPQECRECVEQLPCGLPRQPVRRFPASVLCPSCAGTRDAHSMWTSVTSHGTMSTGEGWGGDGHANCAHLQRDFSRAAGDTRRQPGRAMMTQEERRREAEEQQQQCESYVRPPTTRTARPSDHHHYSFSIHSPIHPHHPLPTSHLLDYLISHK